MTSATEAATSQMAAFTSLRSEIRNVKLSCLNIKGRLLLHATYVPSVGEIMCKRSVVMESIIVAFKADV